MKSEIILSLKPKFAELLENRKKDHEFRKYVPRIAPQVAWFYITLPVGKLLYKADIGDIIQFPCKITDESGVGNKEFNQGLKKSKFAYPIAHLYKLTKPLALSELRQIYGFSPPQGFAYTNRYETLDAYLNGSRSKLIKLF